MIQQIITDYGISFTILAVSTLTVQTLINRQIT